MNQRIRIRIDTLLHERGIKWADVYKELGWNKSFASHVRNGNLIPPLWQRVALAKFLGVDSTVIWGEVLTSPLNESEVKPQEIIK